MHVEEFVLSRPRRFLIYGATQIEGYHLNLKESSCPHSLARTHQIKYRAHPFFLC